MERLILASSNPGDLVLDPFCGVGTVLVACEALERRFIGFEQNQYLVTLAYSRIREAIAGKKAHLLQKCHSLEY